MYTKGIKKILITDESYNNLDKLQIQAALTGHLAIVHRGDVYINIVGSWHKSPFHINDFSDRE
tara:strand:+ start:537 stop:725 length:189 start_codon:yes stop_codon:yes gene_type:complete